MTNVYQDFLPEWHFADIKRLFMTEMIPWHFTDRVVSTEKHFMFGHTFMEDGKEFSLVDGGGRGGRDLPPLIQHFDEHWPTSISNVRERILVPLSLV